YPCGVLGLGGGAVVQQHREVLLSLCALPRQSTGRVVVDHTEHGDQPLSGTVPAGSIDGASLARPYLGQCPQQVVPFRLPCVSREFAQRLTVFVDYVYGMSVAAEVQTGARYEGHRPVQTAFRVGTGVADGATIQQYRDRA